MKRIKLQSMLAVMFMFAGVAVASWDVPAGGWDMEYTPATDGTPSDAGWSTSGGGSYSLITDEVLETDVLKIYYGPSSSSNGPSSTIDIDVTSNASSYVCEIKFRMPNQYSTRSQLKYVLQLGNSYWDFSLWNSNSGAGTIKTQGSTAVACSDIDLDWHTIRIEVSDLSADVLMMDLYLDGSTTAITSFAASESTTYSNYMGLMDNTWYVAGTDTRIDYVKYAVVPEPATIAMLALGGLLSTRNRRR